MKTPLPIALGTAAALALAGCTTPAGPVEVTRFVAAERTAELGKGPIFVETATGGDIDGLAFAPYKAAVADELGRLGYREADRSEAGQIAHQLWHEENPDVQGHDHPEIETTDEHKTLAERRVRLGLLLAELGQKAEVQVTDAEMTQAIMNQARQYPGQERQFFEFVQQNQQMQQQMRAPLFEDKVVDHVFDQATLTEKEVSKEDLQKAVESLEDE